ncbi:MAG: PKD domain-containing protein [Planctomycetota bacterium]
MKGLDDRRSSDDLLALEASAAPDTEAVGLDDAYAAQPRFEVSPPPAPLANTAEDRTLSVSEISVLRNGLGQLTDAIATSVSQLQDLDQVVEFLESQGVDDSEISPATVSGFLGELHDQIDTQLITPLQQYLDANAGSGTLTVQGVVNYLNATIAAWVEGEIEQLNAELEETGVRLRAPADAFITDGRIEFGLDFQFQRASRWDIQSDLLADNLENVGLDLDLNATVDAFAAVDFKLSFGVETDPTFGFPRFFGQIDEPIDLAIGAGINDGDFVARVGIFDVGLSDASADFALRAQIIPDSDSADSVVDASLEILEERLAFRLPLFLQIGTWTLPDPPALTLTVENLLTNPQPSIEYEGNLEGLQQFRTVSADGVIDLFQSVGSWLVRSAGESLGVDLAIADVNLSDYAVVGAIINHVILPNLRDDAGNPRFETVDDLLNLIDDFDASSDFLGSVTLDLEYDEAENQINLAFTAGDAQSDTTPLRADLDLGELLLLEVGTDLETSAAYDVAFDLSIDLRGGESSIVANGGQLPGDAIDILPTDGRLSADAVFRIGVAGLTTEEHQFFDITVSPDASNTSADHLIADINAAIASAGADAYVRAELTDDGQLRLADTTGRWAAGLLVLVPEIGRTLVGGSALPADGVTTEEASFLLSTDGQIYREIIVPPAADSPAPITSRADLVASIQSAIDAAGFVGQVFASVNHEGRLVLSSAADQPFVVLSAGTEPATYNDTGQQIGGIEGINPAPIGLVGHQEIAGTTPNAARTELRLAAVNTPRQSFTDRVTVNDLSASGSVVLSADPITADARLGFTDLTVVDGLANAHASFTFNHLNPATGEQEAVRLSELLDAVGSEGTAAFDLTFDSGAVLDLSNIQFANSELDQVPGIPGYRVEWADLTDLSTLVITQTQDFDALRAFAGITLNEFILVLDGAIEWFQELEKTELLSDELPVINKSVNDHIKLSEELSELRAHLIADPPESFESLVDEVTRYVKDRLGIDAEVEIKVSTDESTGDPADPDEPKKHEFRLDWDDTFEEEGELGIFLDAAVADGLGLTRDSAITAESDAERIQIKATADVDATFGVILPEGGLPEFYVKDDATFNASVLVDAEGLDLGLDLGSLPTLYTKDAIVRINDGVVEDDSEEGGAENESTEDQEVEYKPLTFNVTLKPDDDTTDGGNDDGRYGLFEALGQLNLAASGNVYAELPLFFPTPNASLGDPLVLAIDDISNPLETTTITGPNLEGLIAALNLEEDLTELPESWDELARYVENILDGEVFGIDLPFIGDDLREAANFMTNLRILTSAAFLGADLYDGQLHDDANLRDEVHDALWDALGHDEGGAGLILAPFDTDDPNPVQREAGTKDDILVELSEDELMITTRIGQTADLLDLDVDLDLGLPGLGLDINGDVKVEYGWDFDLQFGVIPGLGVFLVTDESDSELSADIRAYLPGGSGDDPFEATATMGFLRAKAMDDPDDPSEFTAAIDIDLHDLDGDGRLTLAEATYTGSRAPNRIVDFTINAELDANLKIVADTTVAGLPAIEFDVLVDWVFAPDADASEAEREAASRIGNVPEVRLENIVIDLSATLGTYVGPILAKIDRVIDPVRPALDALQDPIPVLSDLLDRDINFIDLARIFGYEETADFIDVASQIASLVSDAALVSNGGHEFKVPIGTFSTLFGGGINLDLRSPENDLSDLSPEDILQFFVPSGEPVSFDDPSPVSAYFNRIDNVGLALPLIDNPALAFNLLLGQDIPLLTWDWPAFELRYDLDPYPVYPIIPPFLFGGLQSGIAAGIDLGFGYDTRGYRQFQETGREDQLLNGFYISDTANADGTGPDVSEAYLSAYVAAVAEFNLFSVFRAGIRGGLFANFGLNLNDTDNNGVVYIDEFIDLIDNGGLFHTFGYEGELGGFVDAYVTIDLGIFKKTWRFDIAEVVFLEFEEVAGVDDRPTITDRFTGNGTRETAENLGLAPGLHLTGTAIRSAAEQDWYRFELADAEHLSVFVTARGGPAPDLSLYDANGDLISRQPGEFADGFLEATLPAGEYFLHLASHGPVAYDLEIVPHHRSETNVYYVAAPDDNDLTDNLRTTAAGRLDHDGRTADTPLPSIQAVLDRYNLNDDDMIVVEVGEYFGGTTIGSDDSGVTIAGSRQETVVGGRATPVNSSQWLIEGVPHAFIVDDAADVTLTDFNIVYASVGVDAESESRGLTVSNIVFGSPDRVGNGYDSSVPHISIKTSAEDGRFTGNVKIDGGFHPAFITGFGIHGSVIDNNQIYGAWAHAVQIPNSHNVSIVNNHIENAGGSGNGVINTGFLGGGLTTSKNTVIANNYFKYAYVPISGTHKNVHIYGNVFESYSVSLSSDSSGWVGVRDAASGETPNVFMDSISSSTRLSVVGDIVVAGNLFPASDSSSIDVPLISLSDGATLRDTQIIGAGFAVEAQDAHLENNYIRGTGVGTGVSVSGDSSVVGNRIEQLDVGIHATGGTIVSNNIVFGNQTGLDLVAYSNSGSDELIASNNIVYGNSTVGIQLYADNRRTPERKAVVAHNTVSGSDAPAIRIESDDVGDLVNIEVLNNIFVSQNSEALILADTIPLPTGNAEPFVSDRNVFYVDGAAGVIRYQDQSGMSLADWHTATGLDGGSVTGDPQFVDVLGPDGVPGFNLDGESDDDFRLLPGSPAINIGGGSSAVPTDIDGKPRDATPDAGAYEGDDTPAAVATATGPEVTSEQRYYGFYYLTLTLENGDLEKWEIDWGDGTGLQEFVTANPNAFVGHQYTDGDGSAVTIQATAVLTNGLRVEADPHVLTVNNIAPYLHISLSGVETSGGISTATTADEVGFRGTVGFDPGEDTVTNWTVNWGDGEQTSVDGASANLSHTYSAPGTYTISGTATDEDGTYAFSSQTVVIEQAIIATATGPATHNENRYGFAPYRLNLSLEHAELAGWRIDWGDGTIDEVGAVTQASHNYVDGDAAFDIVATALIAGGEEVQADPWTVQVQNVAPTIVIFFGGGPGGNHSAVAGEAVSYSTLIAFEPGLDTITQWTIDWGDGQSQVINGGSVNVTHVYDTPGTYTATGTVTDEDGTYDLAAVPITITAPPPVALATGPETHLESTNPYVDLYQLELSVANGEAESWVIDWGDGSAPQAFGAVPNAQHVYADGDQLVTIQATATLTTGEQIDAAPFDVMIQNVPPLIGAEVLHETGYFTIDSAEVGQTVLFQGFVNFDPGIDRVSEWLIDWGDGNSEVVAGENLYWINTPHIYTMPGTYTITGTATDEDGTYDFPPVTLNVNPAAPALLTSGGSGVAEDSFESIREPVGVDEFFDDVEVLMSL